jgi:hypothetical protein
MRKFYFIFWVLLNSHLFCHEQPQGDLSVLLVSPRNELQSIDQANIILVAFNRPMVALQQVPTGEGTGLFKIEPAIIGKFRWMGTSTLTFSPSAQLPYATAYTIQIPAGITSLDGKTLQQSYIWQFETPRPRVQKTSPRNNERYVELDHSITLVFNQPMDPQLTSQFVSIQQNISGSITYPGFIAQQTPTGGKDTVLLIPSQSFPKGATITVLCKMGLLGIGGPLGMSENYSFSFSTFGEF